MSMPSKAPEQRKIFRAASPSAARDSASEWLRDFRAHGPLDIRSIRVSEKNSAFIATVVYSEAEIETTPRHFPDFAPSARSAA